MFDDVGGAQKGAGHHVHSGHMGDEDILKIGGVAARLGVEVGAAVLEASAADDFHHGLRQLVVVDGELVCVPSVLLVAAIGVDAAQHAGIHGAGQFVLEGVSGQSGVVHLDVHLEVLVQAVSAQEADNGLCVNIVLVLGGLHGLRFYEEGALEAFCSGIVAGSAQHGGQVFLLTLLVGIQQGHVAFATAPEDIACAAQLDGGVDGVLYLHNCAGYYVEVGIRGGAVHVALVAEDVGRAPEQLDVGELLHLLEGIVGNDLHALFVFLDGGTLLDEVHVVEAEVVNAQLVHQLEACIHLVLGPLDGALGLFPLIGAGLTAELVAAGLSQCMPPGHSELQPVLHFLSHHNALGLVVVEGHHVLTLFALKGDFSDKREILFFHNFLYYYNDFLFISGFRDSGISML